MIYKVPDGRGVVLSGVKDPYLDPSAVPQDDIMGSNSLVILNEVKDPYLDPSAVPQDDMRAS